MKCWFGPCQLSCLGSSVGRASVRSTECCGFESHLRQLSFSFFHCLRCLSFFLPSFLSSFLSTSPITSCMYIYLCMYVCMYICMYVCKCMYYLCTCLCILKLVTCARSQLSELHQAPALIKALLIIDYPCNTQKKYWLVLIII